MAITPEERRRMRQQSKRKEDRRRPYLRAVPSARADLATEPGVRLTWPMAVGAVITAVIIALGAVALGNGGSVDLGITQFMFPRVH